MDKMPIDGADDKVSENETPEAVEAPKPEPETEAEEDEVVEDVTPMTLDDIVERVTGMVKNARNAGVTTITKRLFAGLEGFFGGVTGDDEKKPPRKG